mmetsp:Transcript_8328/g.20391  ORF Transcript_8328/g.20391 Transcript_8328/m.20391 type:complete len:274 (+) Transcript_8328:80-901(+)
MHDPRELRELVRHADDRLLDLHHPLVERCSVAAGGSCPPAVPALVHLILHSPGHLLIHLVPLLPHVVLELLDFGRVEVAPPIEVKLCHELRCILDAEEVDCIRLVQPPLQLLDVGHAVSVHVHHLERLLQLHNLVPLLLLHLQELPDRPEVPQGVDERHVPRGVGLLVLLGDLDESLADDGDDDVEEEGVCEEEPAEEEEGAEEAVREPLGVVKVAEAGAEEGEHGPGCRVEVVVVLPQDEGGGECKPKGGDEEEDDEDGEELCRLAEGASEG